MSFSGAAAAQNNRFGVRYLGGVFKNVGLSFDNDLNKATYGVKAAAILSDADGKKVPHIPGEVNQFAETVGCYFSRE